MKNLSDSQIKDRMEQICNESYRFIGECKNLMQDSKRLINDASQKTDELMILKEEMIANKCESIELIRLATQSSENVKRGAASPNIEMGIAEDTRIALKILSEIKLAVIPEENLPLQALRSKLLSLSFLPA